MRGDCNMQQEALHYRSSRVTDNVLIINFLLQFIIINFCVWKNLGWWGKQIKRATSEEEAP